MTMEMKDGVLHCAGTLAVDDAEQLLQLVLEAENLAADLSACEHVHSACLQVLMAARIRVTAWPEQAVLGAWLRAAIEATN
jgi:anti-anti-sigma regulatory factor